MSLNEVSHLALASDVLLAPHGLDISDLHRVFDCVHEHQVDYADLYLQSTRQERWSMEDGVVKSGSFSVDQGFGLRALNVDETAFAYSQHIDRQQLMEAARSVRTVAMHGDGRIELKGRALQRSGFYGHDDPLQACEAAEKIALLQSVDRKARALDPRVCRVMAHLELSHSVVMVMRHDGRLAADLRPMLLLQMRVFVNQNGRFESSGGSLGGRSDFGLFSDARVDQELRRVVDSALINLEAEAAPAGSMPVVIGPGWPGMLLHEAMGHGFEGDFNRMGTSIYSGKIGQRVASPGVNIVDDATLSGRRGSLHIDDEGEPGQCTTLIEDGILAGYMHDSLNARLMKQHNTGNGRRESYSQLPMPRMTNTFMLAGEHSPEEIISSVKNGIYLADLGSGQVDIVNGQFTFESELAYLIENGKITRPVKGVTLTGSGPQTLKMISMIGNDLALDNGGATCGKSGQSVPVCVGQPTIKIDQLVVGGTA
ncbi:MULTISPECIES: metalloprotease TldD [Pseudomonas]|uniref:Metalloprotease TldD n=1 Tax=Pseudomonas canadensis TaxID=915099 RepID=A0ABZ0ZZZ8_9PSED|nr:MULTISPECIES: metalloprotease TldD [Pseudomonas]MDF3132772.1 metalloprotease TldD [Pseudomonas extremaustralis]NMX53015.1 metalloprotease TldD [Pseudomonas veronii]WRI21916.1 metalloprotease TldD [Pseudomonas canadensis]